MDRVASRDDRGAALILAMVFLLTMGLIVVALGQLAVQSSSTTIAEQAQSSTELGAEGAATAAIQQVRTSFTYPQTGASTAYSTSLSTTPTAQTCVPTGISTTFTVYCEGWTLGQTRLVEFFVCGPTSISAANCTGDVAGATILYASVTFNDVPAGESPNSKQCFYTSSTNFSNATCGASMSINQWDLKPADS